MNKRKFIWECVLFGLFSYVFSRIMNDPNQLIAVLIYMGLALILGVIIRLIMTQDIYHHRFLKHAVPLAIVNLFLISMAVVLKMTGLASVSLYSLDFWLKTLLVNIILLGLSLYRSHHLYKRYAAKLSKKQSHLEQ